MIKTPEEMAEKYLEQDKVACDAINHAAEHLVKDAFLAGYQAAKDTYKDAISTYEEVAKQMMEEAVRIMSPKNEVADASKVMNSPEKLDSWISVKDRLPEEGVGWTTVYGCILSRWSVQPGFYVRESKEWVSRFIGGYMDDEGYAPFESVTHWMPLPEAPKEEK